jgi:hypothetical protein
MKSRLVSLREVFAFSLVMFFLPGNPFAISAAHPDPSLEFSDRIFFNLLRTQAFESSLGMPGETPVFADFDGDQKQDVAIARLSANRYSIVLSLSTRSEVTVLNPSVPLAGFAVYAYDFNNDSFPDVVVTDAGAGNPLAVWLGDGRGNFEIADQNLFEYSVAFSESSAYKNNVISPEQDLLNESPDSTCGKIASIFGDPGLERKGLIAFRMHADAIREAPIATAPRSPPPNTIA